MKNPLLHTALLATFLAFNTPTTAQPSLTESFTTTTYQYQPTTQQPNWNTTTAQLHLNPFTSSLAGQAAAPGNLRHIATHGRYAYLAAGTAGIQILDLANPALPILVGTHNTPGDAIQIHLDGNYAYVADQSAGLRVLDITNPVAPVEIASLTTADPAVSITADGNFAFVGVGKFGIEIIDITNPKIPVQLTIIDTDGDATQAIKVAGDHLYIADNTKGLVVIDISNPLVPIPVSGTAGPGDALDLEIHGDLAYISAKGFGLWIADISDPTQPSVVGAEALSGEVLGLHLQGNRVFMANMGGALQVVDVSDPTAPFVTETIATPDAAADVLVRGAYAFVALPGEGLQTVHVADQIVPALRTSGSLGSGGQDAATQGSLVFESHISAVRISDYSDPDNPVQLGSFSQVSSAHGVAVAGDLMVIGSNSGCTTVDITDPTSPAFLGSVHNGKEAWDLALSGNHAYLVSSSGFDDYLEVVDFSNPNSLAIVNTVSLAGYTTGIVAEGNLLFLFGYTGHVLVMDISDPTQPVALSSYFPGTNIFGLDVEGDLAYLACQDGVLRVLDISDPAVPFLAGSASPGSGSMSDVVVIGDMLYVAQGDRVEQMSLTDPVNPAWTANSFYQGRFYNRLLPLGGLMLAVAGTRTDVLAPLQYDVDLANRFGASLLYPTGPGNIARYRLTSNHTGPVAWSVNVANANGFIPTNPGQWYQFDNLGPGVGWLAELGYAPGVVTAIDDVTIEWLYQAPFIHEVADVPDDQGGQVRLEWARSAYDEIGANPEITQYAVYREAAAGNGWDFLLTVPVLLQDRYSVVVSTLADSTISGGAHFTSFQVVALTATPGQFFTSNPDSGSSVDNLAPQMPQGITAAYAADGVDLNWQGGNESDLCCYRVYRDTQPGFTPTAANLIQQVGATFFTDNTSSPWAYHYQITAVDLAGNESPAGEVLSATDAPGIAARFALKGAVPNPFNPATEIRYSLARAGAVQLSVYDVAGRCVRTLVDDVLPLGNHQARWDGRNQSGQAVASGVYFARLRSGREVQSQRMMLMK